MKDFSNWVSAQTGGLKLIPRDRRAAFVAALACIAGVTLWAVLLNVVVFKGALPPGHREIYTSPLWPRTLLFSARALTEELLYRLVLMTAFVMLGVRLLGRAPALWVAGSIALAQLIGVLPAIMVSPVYASLYFWLIGCVWGWLYWRHGWITAAISHFAIHLVLDPLLFWLL